ncbi:hypothetical protein ACT8ZV_00835 [Nocardioides sp. MAHUQ-72]|uniref:hypothetical protein n=1 Tax=unclassified Nocardioides TaxID=2615069 RepID=UPI003609566F
MSRIRILPALVLLVVLALLAPPASAAIEDYPDYQPQTRCAPHAKPGTTYLGRHVVKRFGGGFGPIARPCGSGGTSEHKEGRAFDWVLDATRKKDRSRARAFMDWVFATDRRGNTDARARRMGIMYVIWNDHMYSAWDRYEREPYLSSSCRTRKRCSKTLRHRDHLHISLTRKGGKGRTSWYDGRLPAQD